jgi:transposase
MNQLNLLGEKILSSLNIQENDKVTQKFLMLLEGQGETGVEAAAQKFGYSRQRYYQLLRAYRQWGMIGLKDKIPGPKTASLKNNDLANWVIRYKFQDPKLDAAVIAQKLRQNGFKVSERSIQRIIERYGLQKKTSTN